MDETTTGDSSADVETTVLFLACTFLTYLLFDFVVFEHLLELGLAFVYTTAISVVTAVAVSVLVIALRPRRSA